MRIVGGSLGGRRLRAPKGTSTRPTSERAREGLASALAARGVIQGARVLDLYAGSGALGFEMVSRGAERAVFVERDPQVARLLNASIAELEIDARCEVLCDDATRSRAHKAILARGPFTLVLADPPYRDVQAAVDALVLLCANGALAPGACLLLEHGAKGPPVLPQPFACSLARGGAAHFDVVSTYRYGDTAVILLAFQVSDTPPAEGEAP